MGSCNSIYEKERGNSLPSQSLQNKSSTTDAQQVEPPPHRDDEARKVEDLSSEKKKAMVGCSAPRQCSKLAIYTEVNSVEDKEMRFIGASSMAFSKYAVTPVVALAPFAARGSRMLAASMFRKLYGKSEDAKESQKVDNNMLDGGTADKIAKNDKTCTCTILAEEVISEKVVAVLLEDVDVKSGSTDNLVSLVSSIGNTSPNHGVGNTDRTFSTDEKEEETMKEQTRGMGEKDAKGLQEAGDKVATSNGAKTDWRNFFVFRSRDPKSSNDNKKLLESGERKKKGKENGDGLHKNNSAAKSGVVKARTMSREQTIHVGWRRLQQRLGELKLVEHRVKDDGNCQFRAFAQQLLGSEEYHELVRVHVVTYMMSVRERFDCYFGSKEEADHHYRSMLKNGTWGDELTLRAASDSLFVNIHVLSSEQQNFYIVYRPSADAPPSPAFLVDIATLRKQRQQRSANGSHMNSLQQQSLTTSANSGSGTSDSSAAETKTPETFPVCSALSGEVPRTNEKIPDMLREGEHDLVDVCALQRHLQRKLGASMIRTASAPMLDRSAFSGLLIQRSGSLRKVSSVSPLTAMAGDMPCKNVQSGSLDGGLTTESGGASPVSNSEYSLHLRTVSEEIAKFIAMGAERMDEINGKFTTVFLSDSIVVGGPVENVQCEEGQENKKEEPDGLVSDANAPTPAALPTDAGFVLFSPEARNKAGTTVFLGGDWAQHEVHTPEISFDIDLNNTSTTNNSIPPLEDDHNTCFVFEGHSEPIDVFLSYLSPLHYNALSLAESAPYLPPSSGSDSK